MLSFQGLSFVCLGHPFELQLLQCLYPGVLSFVHQLQILSDLMIRLEIMILVETYHPMQDEQVHYCTLRLYAYSFVSVSFLDHFSKKEIVVLDVLGTPLHSSAESHQKEAESSNHFHAL